MCTKSVFLLAVVCVAMTSAGVPYGGRGPAPGGNGGIPGGMIPGGIGGIPGGSIPGGIGECLPFDPLHLRLANFAVTELGAGYSLRQILGVRSRVVAGIMYHMELYVSKYSNCEHCDVEVWHTPWGQGPEMTLHDKKCKFTCCRL